VIYSENGDVQPIAFIPAVESVPNPVEVADVVAENHPLLAKPVALEPSSTNPIPPLQVDGPLLRNLHAQPISFTLPFRN
jgi:hypothetical protein